jgi:putative phosphoesterase
VRVAAISDIHGNMPAFDAVLSDIEKEHVDIIIGGGDFASGPMPWQVLDRLSGLGDAARLIRGNADRELVADFDSPRPRESASHGEDPWQRRAIWSAAQISPDQRNFLAGLPSELRVDIDGLGQTLFCHGSPRGDDDIITPGTPKARLDDVLRDVEERVVVVGHTHMQFDRRHSSSRLINPGSVGMPYEGRPGAYWALLGPDVELRRTAYDFEAAAQSILDSGYPDAEQHVRDLFLEQPGRDVVTSFFEGLQQKRKQP